MLEVIIPPLPYRIVWNPISVMMELHSEQEHQLVNIKLQMISQRFLEEKRRKRMPTALLNQGISNYYMAFNSLPANWFELKIPNDKPGKHYRYTMRMYFLPEANTDGSCACQQWNQSAMFRVRTEIGTTTHDIMEIKTYNDATGVLVSDKSIISDGTPNLYIKDMIPDLASGKGCGVLYRFDVSFYEHFQITSNIQLLIIGLI
jgi:hypothetical protein